MKTKTNKIPLVGPRGRQEILKQVEKQKSVFIRPLVAKYANCDAYALLQLKLHYLDGTIFNTILCSPNEGSEEHNNEMVRINTVFEQGGIEYFVFSVINEEQQSGYINVYFSVEELKVLQKIQEQTRTDNIPVITVTGSEPNYILYDGRSESYICIDGMLVKIDVEDDFITGYEITDQKPEVGEKFCNISEDDMSVLIGYAVF